jgi:hypothetical protein
MNHSVERRAHSVEEGSGAFILYAKGHPLNAKHSVDSGTRGVLYAKCYPLYAEHKGAIGFDREARIKEACRGLLTRKQAELNTTADSFEYALAA